MRFIGLTALIILFSAACTTSDDKDAAVVTISPQPTETSTRPATITPTNTSEPVDLPVPAKTSTPAPAATNTSEPPTITPTNTVQPTATAKPLPTDLAIDVHNISLFPVPSIYEGDLVSVRIDPHVPEHIAPNDVDVLVLLDGEEIAKGNLNYRNLNGDAYGLYQWVWDTAGVEGIHTLTAVIDPADLILVGDEDFENNTTSVEVVVYPRTELTESEATASWITASTDCCFVRVVSGTAAYRDLSELLEVVDSAFTQASTKLDEPLEGPYDVFLIDRVIGQGGYASDSMVVSYLDRDYAGSGIYEVLVHEAVHLMDRQFAPKRISFLSEGLAVWATGGHYRQENIDQKMAGIVEGGWYIPIDKVVDQIYSLQHELSYLEAASFLSYIIDTYGWNRVRDFYADTDSDDGLILAKALETNLEAHFGRSLEELESDWMAYLERQPRDTTAVANLRTTIRFYNVMRRYQQQYDPTAYYLNAWLPSPQEALDKSATADLTRHPESTTNIALETVLMSANRALGMDDFALANAYLDTVDRILESGGQFVDPLSGSFLDIVRTAEHSGYEVQEIFLTGDRARVLAVLAGEQELSTLQLELSDNAMWVLVH